MNILDYTKEHILFLDGGMGTLLQSRGLSAGELPEMWNITHPEVITDIHRMYYDAGSNVVNTNTFGANLLKFSEEELEKIITAAVENAKKAREMSINKEEKYIALDIGPCGRLLKPFGDLPFEDAVRLFSKTVETGVKCGVDLIFIETMNDLYEAKAALLAAKESCSLPVFVSVAFSENDTLMTGASPEAVVATLEGLGADAIGTNCSFGPGKLHGVVEKFLENASGPVLFKPNAGLPKVENGKTVFDITPEEFASIAAGEIKNGIGIAGGCCGTTPEYISLLKKHSEGLFPRNRERKNKTVVSSYTHTVEFGKKPIIIGERINPTGKKKLKAAITEKNFGYILKEGLTQAQNGADVLDVNVGLPGIDECDILTKTVTELQGVCDLPLQIDTSNPRAMECAMREYNGKPLINSVNGKAESMAEVFPLVKKYGGVVIALTLDENGIPENAEGRFAIAKKILCEAGKYGIEKKDIIFDPLALTVSANDHSGRITLDTIKLIKNELGANTSLGISNISFGLPQRDTLNSAFFLSALECGLSAAIVNPLSVPLMQSYRSYLLINGYDKNCEGYIKYCAEHETAEPEAKQVKAEKTTESYKSDLSEAIIKGLKESAGIITKKLIKTASALDIINEEIIPALDVVGVGYENKKIFLPQLLMSAESAKSAFDVIKDNSAAESGAKKIPFVIATVKGDIHDIGKNIVRLLLENYGFSVYDCGKDVEPEIIVDKIIELHAGLCGLSALMTTTVPAMEKTIKLIHEKAPFCRVIVGGAVLNREYAKKINADFYAGDAMETVRIVESVSSK